MIGTNHFSTSRSPPSSDQKLYPYISYEKPQPINTQISHTHNYQQLKKYTQYLRNQILQLQNSNQFFAKRNLAKDERNRKNMDKWKKEKQQLQAIIQTQNKQITVLQEKIKQQTTQSIKSKNQQEDFNPKMIMEQMKLLHNQILKLQAITIQGIAKRKTSDEFNNGLQQLHKRQKSIISNLQPDTFKNLLNFRDRICKLAAFTRKPKESLTKQIRLSISKLKRKKKKLEAIPFIVHNDPEIHTKKCQIIQQSIDGYMNELKNMIEHQNQEAYR